MQDLIRFTIILGVLITTMGNSLQYAIDFTEHTAILKELLALDINLRSGGKK